MNEFGDGDIDRTPAQEAIDAIRQTMPQIAAFTAQAEIAGYSRAEAMQLTGEYLRALVTGGKQ